MRNDLTVIFYTANYIDNFFASNVRKQLVKSINGLPLIVVSHKLMGIEMFEGHNGKYTNILFNAKERSFANIYRQALIGVIEAKTKYVVMAEDDVLYHSSHFDYTPGKGIFAYDRNIWNIYTWTKPPVFSYKGRRNLNGLICERDLFIEAMEERFAKYNEENFPEHLFGEPGKYERQLGVTVRNWEFYHPKKPSVAFSHPTELSYLGLGKRKRIGENACEELEPWGEAKNVLKLYYDK